VSNDLQWIFIILLLFWCFMLTVFGKAARDRIVRLQEDLRMVFISISQWSDYLKSLKRKQQ